MNKNVFSKYADYYDLLYQDKNYIAECNFLEEIFKRYSNKNVKTILDLGCGTGGHSLILAERGYKITGMDISDEMLNFAKKKADEKKMKVQFINGDIRNLKLNRKFDAVISMFAVVSYQITNNDIISAFKTASRHLKKNGLFIFDVWFGPAVLSQKPVKRRKTIKKENEKIIRYATPELDIINHIVTVNYKVLNIKNEKIIDETKESHKVRFLFPQEIKYFLETQGFELKKLCPFMEIDGIVTADSWNIAAIGEKL